MMFGNWSGDDKVTRFLRWDAHKTIDDTKNMIRQWVNNYQYDSTYYWGMYLKSGEMIGSIGITISSECDFKGELGYKIRMHYEGLLIIKTHDNFTATTTFFRCGGYSKFFKTHSPLNICRAERLGTFR